ncbi:MAG TPA: carbohydrate porin [Minicystis sp.]|nr:carbohydrate porin [Minicystis sp.]
MTLAVVAAPALASADETKSTLVDHPDDARVYVGGQANAILQGHPSFHAAYSGPNSLRPDAEAITSYVFTLFFGVAITRTTELWFDGEMAAGGGISSALGLAGFTNLDVVRNPSLGSDPYPARFFLRQIIPLSHVDEDAPRQNLSMATRVPDERIEIHAGKLSTVDFFDQNAVASDSHRQFMNWTVDDTGSYDYAADTRGYTYGVEAELVAPRVTLRVGEMMMPSVANGLEMDTHLDTARGEQVEVDLASPLLRGRAGALRLLGFVNHADMGSYAEAIDAFLAHDDRVPDITAHRKAGRVKYGLALSADQELGRGVRVFLRAGWNDGHTESFAYTEVDDTLALGGDVRGLAWKRPNDKIGIAFVTNGISALHRRYLALGGQGFLLGDGALDYGRETLLETYYDALLYRGVSAAFDTQLVANPGYDEARGPVPVFSLRVHVEI